VFKEINNWFTDFYTFSEFSVKIVPKENSNAIDGNKVTGCFILDLEQYRQRGLMKIFVSTA